MELFLLYALMTLDSLHNVLGLIVTVTVPLLIVGVITYYVHDQHRVRTTEYLAWQALSFSERERTPEPEEYATVHITKHSLFRVGLATLIIAVVTHTLLPNTKQAAVLVAAHYTVEAATSEEGQKLVKLLRLKANAYLDEQLKGVAK